MSPLKSLLMVILLIGTTLGYPPRGFRAMDSPVSRQSYGEMRIIPHVAIPKIEGFRFLRSNPMYRG